MTYYLVFQPDHGSSVMDEKSFNQFVDKLAESGVNCGFEVHSFEASPNVEDIEEQIRRANLKETE